MGEIKYFIITPGRTGSSLLCAMLADAGADFGMDAPADWNRKDGGSMESPLIREAVRQRKKLPAKPKSFPARMKWKWERRRMKRAVEEALESADYHKSINLDLVVPVAESLGYESRIILNIRDYTSFAMSLARMAHAGRVTRDYTLPLYLRTLHDGLMLLDRHGGCVVDYDTLPGWIDQIAATTGLDPADLRRSCERRLSPAGRPKDRPPLNPEADLLYFAALSRERLPASLQSTG